MLEFYRPNAPVNQIEKEVTELIQTLSTKPLSIKHTSVYNLVDGLTGIDLNLFTSTKSLASEVRTKTSLHVSEDDSWADIFFKLMIEIVEPSLSQETLYLLNNYPALVSPLSQPILGTNQAERFEIYWKGMEICNGCRELADPEELKRRYHYESQERIKSSKPPHPEPTDLFNSARKINGASGVAIGLERLFLCLTQE
jgi:lysyl-tRNA synthetase class 2